MKNYFILLSTILYSLFFLNSCSNSDDTIEEKEVIGSINGLSKNSEEYKLGIIKIFKFDGNIASIDESLAKELGFSQFQIKEMKKEIEYNNIIIQEDKDLGSTVEAYNPDNLSAEKILEDSKKKRN